MSRPHPEMNHVTISREESVRFERYTARVGWRTAVRELGVGPATLDAARTQGQMRKATRDRLLEQLAKVEPAAAATAAKESA